MKTIQYHILKRAIELSPECKFTIQDIDKIYPLGRRITRYAEPVKQDYKIAEFQLKFGTGPTMKKFGLKYDQVIRSRNIVATHEWKKQVKGK